MVHLHGEYLKNILTQMGFQTVPIEAECSKAMCLQYSLRCVLQHKKTARSLPKHRVRSDKVE